MPAGAFSMIRPEGARWRNLDTGSLSGQEQSVYPEIMLKQ